ncbi:MAG: DMT family transporter [Chloroflexi bacterium]|nr:MAG: DMT family transporter [Chloroflexota bacterium]TME47166.1 MAG: DMT family transporter [Chloroflexota bacterium]
MTRRLGALVVLLVSQTPTLFLLALLVAVRGARPAAGLWIVAGVFGGLIGLVGLAALYRGMAIGVVSVVAAIAATAPIVPLLFGLALGERPAPGQLVGMGLALGGVLLLTVQRRQSLDHRRVMPGVGLALVAAVAFGLFLVSVRYASRPDPLLGVLAVRAGSVGGLIVLALAFRPRIRLQRRDLSTLVAVGVLDVGADVLFAIATTIGLLSIVSVLSSLYPVATVILARLVLDERMTGIQLAGILLAFGGVLLISL